MNLVAIIPFYNEGNLLYQTVLKVKEYVDYIIAVDDGSNDGSGNLISDFDNVEIIKHNRNRGKGAALKTGFLRALETDCKYVLTIDADLQHDPSFIPSFQNKIKNYDLIIGNRLNDFTGMPFPRRISNTLTSYLLTIKTKKKILDSQCGYRLFKKNILTKLIPGYNGFEAETEILIKAAKLGLKIGFVEIPTIYGKEVSKMRNLHATLGFLKVLINE